MADDLVIKIGGDSSEFKQELDKVATQTKSLEDKLASIAKISGVAFAALAAEATVALHAFAESEQASNKLSGALQAQGIYSKSLADDYKKQADELERLTGIDNDSIVSAQASLQAMIGQTKITSDLTLAIANLSAGKRIDLESSAQLIGKGIEGHTTALKKLGIQIDEHLTKEERTAQIITKVNGILKDAAKIQNEGLGSIKGLNAAYENFQKAIGERLAPAMTAIIQKLTEWFNIINDNKPLLDLIVSLGVAAATIGGIALALTTGAIAFLKFSAALKAAGIAVDIMSFSVKGLIGATGIGLIVVLITEIAMHWGTVWPFMQNIFTVFVNNIKSIALALGHVLMGALTMRPQLLAQGFEELKEIYKKGLQEFQTLDDAAKQDELNKQKAHNVEQNKEAKSAADARIAEAKRKAQILIEVNDLTNEISLDKLNNASAETIKLKQEELEQLKSLEDQHNADLYAATEDRILTLQGLEETDQQDTNDRADTYYQEILDKNEEFAALSAEQRAQFIESSQNDDMKGYETKKTDMVKAAKETNKLEIKEHNQRLEDTRKFGAEYAFINQAMHSAIYAGSKQAFGELAQLTQSKNETLKGIGKAAATANIIIQSAESAMAIFAGFQTAIPFPPVSIPLGIAGAAAAILFGVEKITQVNSAFDGGLMTGGIPGRDSIPALLAPGELVVPTRNFDSVVSAVADQRNRDQGGFTGGGIAGVEGNVGVAISFEGDESERVLTARQNEAKALGTYRGNV